MSSVTTTNKEISQLIPLAQTACNAFMAKCMAEGLDVRITETYRSQERQNYLYSIGRSINGNKVTWTRNSRHTSRRAWDICKNEKGKEYSDKAFFKQCGDIAKELGITWGGTWSTPDTPHFEINVDWKEPTTKKEPTIKKEEDIMGMTASEQAKIKSIDESLSNLYKIVEDIKKDNLIYKTIKDVPEWGKPTVQKLLNNGLLKGDEKGYINLSEQVLKAFVILDRKNVLG